MSEPTTDRAAIAADLERVRAHFHHLLAAAADDDWNKLTSDTRWTNEQLLFHMVFAYMLVRRLLFLVRIFGRLPDRVSRAYARMLEAATSPFHVINYYGSCAASLYYNRRRMGKKMDREISKLQRSLDNETETSLHRGMHYPPGWDPYFRDYMTLADVYRYPGQHYDHHRQQLTLASM
ncbi:maleylpyruvate isomerase [Mycolicibacterium agri]|uniref:Maleylpyruvate isomerase n=1 Tax=Mycolicibacterium agri TaxID=36811 RepID=A0A2A7N895_MYCAG|nr:DinB family protein [Mycolicibacterium agri]PEG39937.1 maleylpyruvate isomerase [Mycolicibacterium agri]GFG51436.1 hypothetical protein MAGR_28770 [Mycolicibacterium agri]